MPRTGPLRHLHVIELAGIGPAPFAGMVLADLGADVVRVERVGGGPTALPGGGTQGHDVLARGRRSVAVDLKQPEGREVLLDLAATADVLLEGFRPGVAERLGVGPEDCQARNPGLVYGRMTGWGQDGPWASMAGHDIDYIAVAGALGAIGEEGAPPPVPLNLIADFGGGGMLLVVGVLAALAERERSGQGQVVDAAMVDGTALLLAMVHGLASLGLWEPRRGANLLDGAAPFYTTYACADGRFVAVGALEPQFYTALLQGVGLAPDEWPQHDRQLWPGLRDALAARFATRTRDDWTEAFAGTDACVAPVLGPFEAPEHPHLAARGTFVDVAGVRQPRPAPRFSRTPPDVPLPPRPAGADTDAVLQAAGYPPARVAALRKQRAIG